MHQSPLALRFPLRLWRCGSRLDTSQGRGGRSPQRGRGKHAAGPARGGLRRRWSRRTVCWSSRKTASTPWSRYQTAEPTRSRDATPLAPRGPVRHDDCGHDPAGALLRRIKQSGKLRVAEKSEGREVLYLEFRIPPTGPGEGIPEPCSRRAAAPAYAARCCGPASGPGPEAPSFPSRGFCLL